MLIFKTTSLSILLTRFTLQDQPISFHVTGMIVLYNHVSLH